MKCNCSKLRRIRTNPDGTSKSSQPTCEFCSCDEKCVDEVETEKAKLRSRNRESKTDKVSSESKVVDQTATNNVLMDTEAIKTCRTTSNINEKGPEKA